MKTKIYIFMLIVFFTVNNLSAQNSEKENYKFLNNWSVNVNFGSSLFWGDLRVNDLWPVDNNQNERKWAYGALLGKRISPLFEIRGQFLFGELSGTKRTEKQYFNADYLEYNIHTTFDFVNLIYGNNPDRKFNFYALLGIGSFRYRSIKQELGTQKILATAGWNANATVKEDHKSELVFPLGLGGRYNIDRRFSITGDVIWKYTNTDLIDLTEGMSKHDVYSYMSLGVTYRFNFSKTHSDMYRKGNDQMQMSKNDCLKQITTLNQSVDSLSTMLAQTQNKAANLEQKEAASTMKEAECERKVDSLQNLIASNSKTVTPVSVDENQNLRQKLNKALLEYQAEGLKVETRDDKVLISLEEKLLFKPGSWTVSEKGIEALKKVANVMEKNPDFCISVEGHTDNLAYNGNGQVKDNWDLSVMRATAIAKIILSNTKIDPNRITVSGHADRSPVCPNNTAENRARNRRAEIILMNILK